MRGPYGRRSMNQGAEVKSVWAREVGEELLLFDLERFALLQ